MSELTINPRFRDLLPPLTSAEFEQLEQNKLGFFGMVENEITEILPSQLKDYWFVVKTNIEGQQFIKRPVAAHGIGIALKVLGCPNLNLTAFKTYARPMDEYTKPYYQGRLKKQEKTNIYFVQAVDGGLVKIGSAVNVNNRLKEHQCGSPLILQIIKVIPDVAIKFEKQLHKRFAKYRMHGEWFLPEVLKENIDIEQI